jgi:Bacterial Ig-like domain
VSRLGLDDVKTSTGGPDTTPPVTYITSGPCGVTSTSVTLEFHSNEEGSTFECQLSGGYADEEAWTDCTSPKSYSNLTSSWPNDAYYIFQVRATDPAGNVDPTGAGRPFRFRDTTAPEVVGTVPKADATGVARTTNVKATFSEDMDAQSIRHGSPTYDSTFKLFKQGSTTGLAASVSYDATTRTAMLDPSKSLSSGATYKAVVSTGAMDLAHNRLAQQYSWFFRVR